MTPETYLRILAFLGLIVGLAGGLVSQLTKTDSDVPGSNKKVLTPFGKLALAISIIGFAGSFVSELLKAVIEREAKIRKADDLKWQHRIEDYSKDILSQTKEAVANASAAQQEALKSQLRTAQSEQKILNDNLIKETKLYGRLSAASAPLTTLEIKLVIPDVPPEIINQIKKGESDAYDSVQDDIRHREWIPPTPEQDAISIQYIVDNKFVQPFISFMDTDKFVSKEGLLAFSFDNEFSSILCVGWISRPEVFEIEGGKSLLPSGIMTPEGSRTPRKKVYSPEVHIRAVKDSVELSISLGGAALEDGILRYSPNVLATASMPIDIKMFAWTVAETKDGPYYRELPFDTKSILWVVRDKDLPFEYQDQWVNDLPKWMRNMRLEVIPNGVEQISRRYAMTPSTSDDLSYVGYLINGHLRIWHGHASDSLSKSSSRTK